MIKTPLEGALEDQRLALDDQSSKYLNQNITRSSLSHYFLNI